jgi:hypothetical protein
LGMVGDFGFLRVVACEFWELVGDATTSQQHSADAEEKMRFFAKSLVVVIVLDKASTQNY